MVELYDANKDSELLKIIQSACTEHQSNKAFKFFDKSITYSELDHLSNNFAVNLIEKLEVKKGDRISLLMPNVIQFPIALIGIFKAGCVAVPLNPLYTETEIEKSMEDSGAKIIVTLDLFAHKFINLEKKLSLDAVITSSVGEHLGALKGFVMQLVLKHVKKALPKYSLDNEIKHSSLIENRNADKLKEIKIINNDLAFIQYTGGTTGTPSGVMLSHGNVSSNIQQTYEWTSNELTSADIILTPLPVYHILSLVGNLFCFMRYGVTNVLVLNARDLESLSKAISKEKPTIMTGVDTLFAALLRLPSFKKIKKHSFRFCVAGGMALRREICEQWQQVTGIPIIQGYGLSEASPVVTLNTINVTSFSPTVGSPLPNTKIKIIDENFNQVAVGEVGQVCVYGPQVMQGYWKNEEKTKFTIDEEGWLRTGDLGYLDHNGELTIVDRMKDLIIVSGFNVFPSEIEDTVNQREDILEAAAVSHVEDGIESIKLFLVPKNIQNPPNKQEIIDYLSEFLAPYKVPKNIHFINELPKSPVGKILKREL